MGFEVEGNQDIDASGIILMESLRGQVIKVEEYSTESCTTASVRRKKPVVDQLNPCEKQRGVRMFLVKEEDSLVTNEHQGFPQHGHTELMGDVQHASRVCLGRYIVLVLSLCLLKLSLSDCHSSCKPVAWTRVH